MSWFYLDTSALVKFYIEEAGSDWVEELFRLRGGRYAIHTAQITGPETISAVRRRENRGDLTNSEARQIIQRFYREFTERRLFELVEADRATVEEAMRLADIHGIRGYDSMQLASALAVERAWREVGGAASITFVAADRALNTVAVVEGLNVVNPIDG